MTHAETPLVLKNASQQLMVVVTKDWTGVEGLLQRYVQTNQTWERVGQAIPIVVGRNGLAWGSGFHLMPQPGPVKKEGDGKAPAGIYALGSTFGYEPAAKMSVLKMPYVQCTDTLECVDDSKSKHYNQIVDRPTVPQPDWNSSEHMHMTNGQYRYGVVIEHNSSPPMAYCGSCVFMHIWLGPTEGTAGCTAMTEGNIKAIVEWLDIKKHPILVQFPEAEYHRVQIEWQLPAMPTLTK